MAIKLGSTAASLGSALGQGISQPLNQALDILAQKKLLAIQQEAKQNQQNTEIKSLTDLFTPIYGDKAAFMASLAVQQPKLAYGLMAQIPQQPSSQVEQYQQPEQVTPQEKQYIPQGNITDKLLQLAGQGNQKEYGGSPLEKMLALQQATQLKRTGEGFMTPPMEMQAPMAATMTQQMPVSPQQQAVAQPMSQAEQMQRAIAGGLNKMSEYQKRMLSEKEESRKFRELQAKQAIQEKIRPYVESATKDFNFNNEIHTIAEEMRDILEKNSKDFPNRVVGLAPQSIQNLLTNASVQRFNTLANKLATMEAVHMKGQPTNFKIKLIQERKPNLTKTIQANLRDIDSILDESSKSQLAYRHMLSLQDENKFYPRDTEEKVASYRRALDKPLSYPNEFPLGMTYVDDKNRKFVLNLVKGNKKWEPKNG